MDGGHSLQDETVEKRRYRNGAARSGLQHDPRHEDHGHSGDDRSDEGVSGLVCPTFCPQMSDISKATTAGPSIQTGRRNTDLAPKRGQTSKAHADNTINRVSTQPLCLADQHDMRTPPEFIRCRERRFDQTLPYPLILQIQSASGPERTSPDARIAVVAATRKRSFVYLVANPAFKRLPIPTHTNTTCARIDAFPIRDRGL